MFDNLIEIAIQYLPRLLKGAGKTIYITSIGVSLGFVIGLFVGFIRAYRIKYIDNLFKFYIDLIRGTPLLVQVFFIFFGIPTLTNKSIDPLLAGIAAISINSGAYFGEIIRGAVQSVHKSQIEAGRSIGLNWFNTLRYIVWPQAFLMALPSLGNQFIISLKDTSLLSVISVEELTRNGQIIIAATFRAFQIWLIVALIYLLMTGTASSVLRRLEDRLSKHIIR
jgi:His/Glu/Gln/Arg/opine family amino acid ABC transporter permease subunit